MGPAWCATLYSSSCSASVNPSLGARGVRINCPADAGLLDRFGVSAGKGAWTSLVDHPRAVVNLLLLRGSRAQLMAWAVSRRCGGRRAACCS